MLKKKLKEEDIEKIYAQANSLSKRLPWCDYNHEHKLFLLEDKKTLAVGFHLTPIACEAKPAEMMHAISKSLTEALKNSIPCEKGNPWILQLFTQRKSDLSDVYEVIEKSAEKFKETEFTQAYLKTIKQHLDYVSNPEGLFFDQTVTQQIFKGGQLEVRAFLYRKIRDDKNAPDRKNCLDEILKISKKFSDQLMACGLQVNTFTGSDFYNWMVRWFNPNLKQIPNEFNQNKKPYGWDLTENLFFKTPKSFAFAGCVSEVLELAEKNQASDRPIYFIADENHLFTKVPLLASIETRIAKMGRKLGLWLWLATQNLKDFAEESRKMLSLLETWVCLALPPDELDQIEKFKTLTPEQRALFLSARKSKGQYTEGVLLSPKMQGLLANATGSLAEMPMYFLSQANPSAYNMIKLIKKSLLKFLKISCFMISLICPLVILESFYPKIFLNTHEFLKENSLFFIGIRFSLIFILMLTWKSWIYKIACKNNWSGDKRRYWLAQRWKIVIWLMVFEVLICENVTSAFYY